MEAIRPPLVRRTYIERVGTQRERANKHIIRRSTKRRDVRGGGRGVHEPWFAAPRPADGCLAAPCCVPGSEAEPCCWFGGPLNAPPFSGPDLIPVGRHKMRFDHDSREKRGGVREQGGGTLWVFSLHVGDTIVVLHAVAGTRKALVSVSEATVESRHPCQTMLVRYRTESSDSKTENGVKVP